MGYSIILQTTLGLDAALLLGVVTLFGGITVGIFYAYVRVSTRLEGTTTTLEEVEKDLSSLRDTSDQGIQQRRDHAEQLRDIEQRIRRVDEELEKKVMLPNRGRWFELFGEQRLSRRAALPEHIRSLLTSLDNTDGADELAVYADSLEANAISTAVQSNGEALNFYPVSILEKVSDRLNQVLETSELSPQSADAIHETLTAFDLDTVETLPELDQASVPHLGVLPFEPSVFLQAGLEPGDRDSSLWSEIADEGVRVADVDPSIVTAVGTDRRDPLDGAAWAREDWPSVRSGPHYVVSPDLAESWESTLSDVLAESHLDSDVRTELSDMVDELDKID